MNCDRWREAISAIIDDETPGADTRLVASHLGRCPDCRAFRDGVHELRRAGVRPAPAMPDLTSEIVTAVLARRQS